MANLRAILTHHVFLVMIVTVNAIFVGGVYLWPAKDNIVAPVAINQSDQGTEQLDATIIELRQALALDKIRNSQLTKENEQLKKQILNLNNSKESNLLVENMSEPLENKPINYFESEFSELWFSSQSLLALGLDSYEVDYLRNSFEQYQLEKINTRNNAASQGLSTSSRLTTELRNVEMRFRNDIGDDNYDKVLYASGEKNRLEISDMIDGSSGHNSGILPGDIIHSYGGERIFDPNTLYLKTKNGTDLESVEIVIERDGELISLLATGGRLGAKIQHIRIPPRPNS